jgi:hypothetical protein
MYERISVSTDFELALLGFRKAPLVSIYLRTHRTAPDNLQDRTRFKNLLKRAMEVLGKNYDRQTVSHISSYLETIEDDPDRCIWRFAKEGLAVLVSKDGALLYNLDYPVVDEVIVSDSYHIRPLIENFQFGSHYYLLALSKDSFELYLGDIHTLNKVEMPEDIKTRLSDLFDDYDDGFSMSGGFPGGRTTNLHGRESKKEEAEKDTEKFFRYVDRAIKRAFTDIHPYPLILMSLTQHQSMYRSLSTIPMLLSEGTGFIRSEH